MDIKKNFGVRVRELRKRAGFTQDQLAQRCGRTFVMQRIGQIERGESNCTLETVEQLARGLSCEPAELFLFPMSGVGKAVRLLDARLHDFWKGADEQTKRRILRILAEVI